MDIVIPGLGDIDEVEVIELCVAVGDVVEVDDAIIVIESDKASMELPSPAAGTITELKVALGDRVGEGHVVAVMAASEPTTAPDPAAPEPAEPSDAPAQVAEQAPVESRAPAESGGTRTVDVLVPDIGDATDVVVIEVAVKEGDEVAPNDLLVVLESDKASMEIAAEQAGKVVKVGVAEGDEVDQGVLIVTLADVSVAVAPGAQELTEPTKQQTKERTDEPKKESTMPEPEAPPEASQPSSKKVYAGPAVRRLARELGVVLADVSGSGNRGRITKDDVKGFVKNRMTSRQPEDGGGLPKVASVDFGKFGEIELVPLSRIRQRGADNLHRSWVNLPHVTQHDEADVTELEEFRRSLKDEAEARGVKVTPLSFLVKACCQALAEFPEVNSSLHEDGQQLVLKKYLNIGFAVDTPEGLVVPVIKAADDKGIWELSAEISALSDKARTKKLAMDDLQGGTFSISSLGAIGGTGFTPIVNAPEVAILGVSRLAMKPIWNGSEFVPRQVLPLSLSYDHRVINGAEGGRFMVYLTRLLGDIRRLML
jgi:pyruvate dehydrogenase E2 component (dihydrolipoamide acetyltransferase)